MNLKNAEAAFPRRKLAPKPPAKNVDKSVMQIVAPVQRSGAQLCVYSPLFPFLANGWRS
jgi:hypothetical protein